MSAGSKRAKMQVRTRWTAQRKDAARFRAGAALAPNAPYNWVVGALLVGEVDLSQKRHDHRSGWCPALHGSAASGAGRPSRGWSPVPRKGGLARTRDCGRPGSDFGHDELADDAMAVIQATGVRRVVPVFQAHGGWPALWLRRLLGNRVPRIVLLSWMVL